jgi:hypothetical protein
MRRPRTDIRATSPGVILISLFQQPDEVTMLRDRLQQNQDQRVREIFESRIAALFEQIPMLSGFYVEADLSVAELTVNSWPGWSASPELREDIADFVRDMADERPDVAEMLRGRTFARSLQ